MNSTESSWVREAYPLKFWTSEKWRIFNVVDRIWVNTGHAYIIASDVRVLTCPIDFWWLLHATAPSLPFVPHFGNVCQIHTHIYLDLVYLMFRYIKIFWYTLQSNKVANNQQEEIDRCGGISDPVNHGNCLFWLFFFSNIYSTALSFSNNNSTQMPAAAVLHVGA